MRKFKKLFALLLALAMVFALAACSNNSGDTTSQTPDDTSSSEPSETNEGTEPAGDYEVNEDGMTFVNTDGSLDLTGVDLSGYTIGYVTITSTAPWGGRVGTEFQRMAEEAGATVRTLDANTVAEDVPVFCQQMIDAGVDALAVFGGDPSAMVTVAENCDAAGIPLFLCALDVAEEGREHAVACIGPDQEQMTYDIGQYVIEDNGTEEEMTVVRISGVPFLADYQQRDAGFERAMSEVSNYTLLETDYAFSSRTDAKGFMETHIQALGNDIDIVMGMDDDLTMGAVQAIDEAVAAGTIEEGQIKVYSLTGQNDAIQAVADGKMQLTVMNRADGIAAESVRAVWEYLTTGSTAYYHYTPLTYITADNVADYVGQGEF